MKAFKTVLFIVCIMVALALLSLFFPQEGVTVGNTVLEFPSLADILSDTDEEDTVYTPSPEELLEIRKREIALAKDSEYVDYMKHSPTRFYMPDDDFTYLDSLFYALENADKQHVRILHYGDSQLEGDRITCVLREKFQSAFGGCGAGMAPAMMTLGMATAEVVASPHLPHYMYFGPAENHAPHHRYGPLTQVARLDGNASFTLYAVQDSDYHHANTFKKVGIAIQGTGTFTVSAKGQKYPLTCEGDSSSSHIRIFSTILPEAVTKATIQASGNMDIYGVMMDGEKGVNIDNIAMRGASGTIFTTIDNSSMKPFFTDENVRLILMQFGGNSVPYLKHEKGISIYKNQMKQQIAHFHTLAPHARIVFIGPSDMATRVKGTLDTYPQLPMVIDSLKAAALESGAAYWDMYQAMGGRGSMIEWAKANPPLAGKDYVHFTRLGAAHISDMLFGTFDIYHKYYQFRKELKSSNVQEDKETTDTIYDHK